MVCGSIVSQDTSGTFEMVTKSADMNTLLVPSMPSSAVASSLPCALAGTNVEGPPTSIPTVNFLALSFGVIETVTGIDHPDVCLPVSYPNSHERLGGKGDGVAGV